MYVPQWVFAVALALALQCCTLGWFAADLDPALEEALRHEGAEATEASEDSSLLHLSSKVSVKRPKDAVQALKETIRRSMPQMKAAEGGLGELQVEGYGRCKIGEGEACPLSAMTNATLVHAQASDQRVCQDGSPYRFVVDPGDSDKLLLYFWPGGACWQGPVGDYVRSCIPDTSGWDGALGWGFFNRKNESNPFRSYTTVQALYCSGDAFMGNATETYSEASGTVHFRGYNNAKSVVDWVKENFPGKLSSLVVSGGSAGALGTAAWSNEVLSVLSYEHAQVLLDSYAGYFPPGTQGPIVRSWGSCDMPIFSKELQQACREDSFTIQDAFVAAMEAHPYATFASLNSKFDGTQCQFYSAVAQSYGKAKVEITGPELFFGVNEIVARYSRQPNYIMMFVVGGQHVFSWDEPFFWARAGGTWGGAGESLIRWTTELVSAPLPASACEGLLLDNHVAPENENFCDSRLLPKVSDNLR